MSGGWVVGFDLMAVDLGSGLVGEDDVVCICLCMGDEVGAGDVDEDREVCERLINHSMIYCYLFSIIPLCIPPRVHRIRVDN